MMVDVLRDAVGTPVACLQIHLETIRPIVPAPLRRRQDINGDHHHLLHDRSALGFVYLRTQAVLGRERCDASLYLPGHHHIFPLGECCSLVAVDVPTRFFLVRPRPRYRAEINVSH